jgi:hypothetical protein
LGAREGQVLTKGSEELLKGEYKQGPQSGPQKDKQRAKEQLTIELVRGLSYKPTKV